MASEIKPPPGIKPAQTKRAQSMKLKIGAKQQYRPNALPQNAYPASIINCAQAMASYATRQPAPRKPGRRLRAFRLNAGCSGRVIAPRGRPCPLLLPSSAPGSSSHPPQSPGIVAAARSWDSSRRLAAADHPRRDLRPPIFRCARLKASNLRRSRSHCSFLVS